MNSKLILNVSPVEFQNEPLEVEFFDFESGNQLIELRRRHYQTHVFKREQKDEADQIICVPLSLDSPTLGGESDIVYLHDNLWLACNLIRNSLINYFHSLGRTVLDFLPIKLVADGLKDDILSQSMLPGVESPEWLTVRPLFDIDVRVFNMDERPPFAGLTLDLRTIRQILWPCSDLIAQGFDPRGLYVKHQLEIRDPRIFPIRELVGRVETIENGVLRLSDSREGFNDIPADEAGVTSRNGI